MNTNPSSPAFSADHFKNQPEVSAFFGTHPEAEKAAEALRAAGFQGEHISLIPRNEDEDIGTVLAVSDRERLAEAATILHGAGGEVGLPSERRLRQAVADEGDEDEPDAESRIFTRGSIAGGSGAGTASGGALF